MHYAFAVLHLSPAAFWAMTPRELAAALPQSPTGAPMAQQKLRALMDQFPDERSASDG